MSIEQFVEKNYNKLNQIFENVISKVNKNMTFEDFCLYAYERTY